MARYMPPIRVKTLSMPFKVLVMRANPEFEKERAKEPFYKFSNGREFNENTAHQGPYSTVPNIR